MPLVNGTGHSPVSGTADPRSSQTGSSGGSVDTTKTRSDPQRVRMSSGERPIGAANGKQPDTEALCQPPRQNYKKQPTPFTHPTSPKLGITDVEACQRWQGRGLRGQNAAIVGSGANILTLRNHGGHLHVAPDPNTSPPLPPTRPPSLRQWRALCSTGITAGCWVPLVVHLCICWNALFWLHSW